VTQHRNLDYGQRLPEALLDAFQEYISTLLVNLRLTISGTVLIIPAGPGNAQVGAGINGRWRWNTSDVSAAHPAGAAGQYDVFLTATDNSFTGGTPETDNTVYTFGMQILAQGSTPGTPLYRKVAETTWNGSAITRVALKAGGSAEIADGAIGMAELEAVIQQALWSPGDVKTVGYPVTAGAEPAGWLLCDGRTVSRTSYAALFARIGTTHNTGGEAGTDFRLPDARSRTMIGAGQGTGLTARALGAKGGAETHTLAATEMPWHGHGVSDPSHAHGVADPWHNHSAGGGQAFALSNQIHATSVGSGLGAVTAYGDRTDGASTGISIQGNYTGISIQGAGGGAAHNNMQPFLAVSVLIKT
jgi:microcystin-dependent protein